MIDFLASPYPLRKNPATEWLYILGTGAFVVFFLIVFQPFGTREFEHASKYLFLAGYGVVTSGMLLLITRVLPPVFPEFFDEEHWTVGKHVLFLMIAFSLVFFACYLYKSWFLGELSSLNGFLGFYPIALSVAVFPIAGLVVGDYILQLKRYQRGADNLNRHFSQKEKTNSPATITLPDENSKPIFEIMPGQLLFLKAADNYVEVYYWDGKKVNRTLLRNTLTSIEKVLALTSIVRCHRSYLVQPHRVEKVSGNAQGYRLHFAGTDFSVPVARSRNKQILAVLKT